METESINVGEVILAALDDKQRRTIADLAEITGLMAVSIKPAIIGLIVDGKVMCYVGDNKRPHTYRSLVITPKIRPANEPAKPPAAPMFLAALENIREEYRDDADTIVLNGRIDRALFNRFRDAIG